MNVKKKNNNNEKVIRPVAIDSYGSWIGEKSSLQNLWSCDRACDEQTIQVKLQQKLKACI